MEKTHERETHDFMNVESFSQLPFIRPAPVNKEKGIKLFGIEFGAEGGAGQGHGGNETECGGDAEAGVAEEASKDGESNGESGRRFECHYCCRNFPTSQALGGHQNAHKRERQHAKRAHLQSAMANGGLSDTHVYGLMNYRFGSATAMTYPTWSNNSSNTTISSNSTRFYGGHGSFSHQQPINGSPLALWRIPAGSSGFSRDHHSAHPLPLFTGDETMKRSPGGANSGNPQSRYVCDGKASMQDHVSLDLHL
ncbi:zinc finger protein 8 [Syzygium oleosum]|uniref:zinc finger protein 8 n=1 Tax=Syzygium oleosum TaxID=219896 RepID=UPI0011D1A446|nr:zinc finger protein 8 [Syzygium oleosum]